MTPKKYDEFAGADVKKQPFVPGAHSAEYDPGTRLDAFGRALPLAGVADYGDWSGVPAPQPPQPPQLAINKDKFALPALTALLPARALQAATMRYASQVPALPAELGASSGYGADYDAAVASDKFTPAQLQAAEAARAKYANTPLGFQGEALRIESKGTLADLTANIAEQRALATAQERADAASANAAVVDEDQAQRFEAMRAKFDESQNKRLADMDELRADIAKTKIDPSQYWSKGSGFGQVLSLLSVAIGGFQHGYSGGKIENTGLKMLDQAIDRDIAAQRANLENKRATLADSQSVFALARQKFGDDRAAEEFTRARQNEALKNAASRYQGEARTEGMRQNAAKLETHFGLQAQAADNRVRQLYATAEAQRLRAAAGAGASAASAAERAEDKAYEKKARRDKQSAELRKTLAEAGKLESDVDGGGAAPKGTSTVVFEGVTYRVPEKGAEELRNMVAAAATTNANAEALVALGGINKDYYNLFSTSPERARGKLLVGELVAGVARINSGGFNPSAQAEENARTMVSEPERTYGNATWETGIRQIPIMAQARTRAALTAAGAVPVNNATEPRKPVTIYESPK